MSTSNLEEALKIAARALWELHPNNPKNRPVDEDAPTAPYKRDDLRALLKATCR